MRVRKTIFGRTKKPKINTFLGGVASTINTASIMAVKLGISVSRIKEFSIIGDNVQCAVIGGSYVLPGNFMTDESNLTYFKDMDGLVISNSTSLGKMFLRCFNLEEVFTPKMTTIYPVAANNVFENTYGNYTKWKVWYAPSLTNIGSTQGFDLSIFRSNFGNSIKLYTNAYLQTSNAGSIEGNIAYFDSLGANSVVFVQNFIKPLEVTNLSNVAITSTTAILNFTPPSSFNAIDYYECYANGELKNKITASGQAITGLSTATNYNITIIAVDIYYNKSEKSNLINLTTT